MKRMTFDTLLPRQRRGERRTESAGLWLTLLTMFMPILLTLVAMQSSQLLKAFHAPASAAVWLDFMGSR